MERILLIEDEQQLQNIYRRFLEDAGYEVVVTRSGFNCLQLIDNFNVDLVITDILMPDGDGIEVIRKVRQRPSPLPVIAITGGGHYQSGKELIEIACSLGVAGTLRKPFTEAELLLMVAKVLVN